MCRNDANFSCQLEWQSLTKEGEIVRYHPGNSQSLQSGSSLEDVIYVHKAPTKTAGEKYDAGPVQLIPRHHLSNLITGLSDDIESDCIRWREKKKQSR